MRRLLLVVTIAFVTTVSTLAPAAFAQVARDPAIEGTIQSQFDAFLKNDVTTAFSFASPGIKGMFGTPEKLRPHGPERLPDGLAPVAGAVSGTARGGRTAVAARHGHRSGRGRTHLLDYQMIQTPDGWQINAVQLLPQVGVGA